MKAKSRVAEKDRADHTLCHLSSVFKLHGDIPCPKHGHFGSGIRVGIDLEDCQNLTEKHPAFPPIFVQGLWFPASLSNESKLLAK